MLYSYLQRTQQLLSDLREVTFNTDDLTTYINIARGQLAGESECIRIIANLTLTPGVNVYPFSAISLYATGSVSSVSITNPGTGYPSVAAIAFSGGGGVNAAAIPAVTGGSISSISVTNGGTGYFAAPITGISPPLKLVSSVTVTAHGSGYSVASVSFSGGGGYGAAALPVLSSGSIASISITAPGGGYSIAPSVTIAGTGTGASASAIITQGVQASVAALITVGSNIANPGASAIFNVRQVSLKIGDGQQLLHGRGFEWFNTYQLNNPVPVQGSTEVWSQYGQGSTGSLYVDPPPDTSYTLYLDSSCIPQNLTDDTTPEAIPYPWTDAVPYFAAYWALVSQPTKQAQDMSELMLKMYNRFKMNARMYSNPTVNPGQWPQSSDPTRDSHLGIVKGGVG